jgi:hypothetical protein
MSFKAGMKTESFVAILIAARVRFFACVGAYMRSQVCMLTESFVAILIAARVRFFACVGAHMRSQVSIKTESFAANFAALIGFLTRMHELMSF